jgi:hypothetical protein
MHEILYLAAGSVIAKLVEDCRKIPLSKHSGRRLKNCHGLYEAFNVHLPVALAVFAFVLSHQVPQDYVFCLFLIVLGGVMAKGVFSHHKPERLAWRDSDARWGLIVPNGCAIAAIAVGLMATYFYPIETPLQNVKQESTSLSVPARMPHK